MKVLLAEDNPRMANMLERALHREGHSVLIASDGEQALQFGRSADFDLILLDVMMPRIDGVTVLRSLRSERRDTPTIMVTARDAMQDIVRCLDSGADDYITKPFALDVLLARIRAVGRRPPVGMPADLTFADLVLLSRSRELKRGDRTSLLTRTEYALMELLLRRPGSVVTRDALIEAGWGFGAETNESTLYVFIRALRSKIGEPQLLHTARGVGYVMRQLVC
jgi:DNA-binding response OmpR family regulator